jgi:hypothetical protein
MRNSPKGVDDMPLTEPWHIGAGDHTSWHGVLEQEPLIGLQSPDRGGVEPDAERGSRFPTLMFHVKHRLHADTDVAGGIARPSGGMGERGKAAGSIRRGG